MEERTDNSYCHMHKGKGRGEAVSVQTLELIVPLLLTGWQKKEDCTCRNHRQWTLPLVHPSAKSSGAPLPLQHTHLCDSVS